MVQHGDPQRDMLVRRLLPTQGALSQASCVFLSLPCCFSFDSQIRVHSFHELVLDNFGRSSCEPSLTAGIKDRI